MRSNLGRQPIQITIAVGLLGLAIALMSPSGARAVPTQVYVCTNISPYLCADGPGVRRWGPYAFENDYVANVLKNEWPQNSNYMQALYAGAITIRTFAQRANADSAYGCGAIFYYASDGLPVENNASQVFSQDNDPGSPDPTPYPYQRDAANQTAGTTILRFNDGMIACARYKTDTGDPTLPLLNADSGSPTLSQVEDDVYYSNRYREAGMSANGSSAWSKGPTNTRLNWPQILGKYYTRIGLSTGTNNTGILIPNTTLSF